MLPVEEAEAGVRRTVTLLLVFVLGCAMVAAAAAVGPGVVLNELFAWVSPQVAGGELAG